MVNYENGKVYKIVNNVDNKCYVGSTTKQYLSQRLDKHRSGYKRWKNGKTHKTSSFVLFDKYGLENCDIILLESVKAKTKDELHARERYYIEQLDCVNIVVPKRTQKEYREQNKEQISLQRKQYYEENKQQIKEYRKTYHKNNKEKLKEYTEKNKQQITERMRRYRQDNKEQLSKYNKEYMRKNNDKIKQFKNKKCTCICGSTYAHHRHADHKRSQRHQSHQQFIDWAQENDPTLYNAIKIHQSLLNRPRHDLPSI
jgi:hypothetical protein